MSSRAIVRRSASVLALSLFAALASPATVAAAPPVNDSLAGATVVSTLPFSATIDLAEATRAPTDPGPCYNDILARWARTMHRTVWYRISPTGFDTMIVRVVASAGRPVFVLGRDVGGSLVGDCQYTGRADATGYRNYADPTGDTLLVIGLADDVAATLTIDVQSGAPRAATNDGWQDPVQIEQTPFTDRVDLAAATSAADDPAGCAGGAPSERTIWYRIRPTRTIRLGVGVLGPTPTVQVLRRTSGSFVQLACADPGTESANLVWTFQAGVTTYVLVGIEAALAPDPPGSVSFQIPNDPVAPVPPWLRGVTPPATTTSLASDPRRPDSPSPIAIGLIVSVGLLAFALAMRRRPAGHS